MQGSVSKWPPLKPLCLILKVFLQQRELNEVKKCSVVILSVDFLAITFLCTITCLYLQVYTGGIGSYALLSMLIAMLRVNILDYYMRSLFIFLWNMHVLVVGHDTHDICGTDLFFCPSICKQVDWNIDRPDLQEYARVWPKWLIGI